MKEVSRPLLCLGGLGLTLSAGCVVFGAMRGFFIPPEGDLTKAITFDFAVGVYVLTIALFVPLARFTEVARRSWIGSTIGLGLYGYGVETIQILRGVDPRFSKVGGNLTRALGGLFFFVALGLIALFTILAVKLWRRGTDEPLGLLLLAIRYAIGATMIAFAAGIWMSFNQGRTTGAAGNILPLHAIGFHGLQAVPVISWLLMRRHQTDRALVHAGGAAWVMACLAVAAQAIAGRSVIELAPATLVAAVAVVLWAAVLVRATLMHSLV